MDIAVITTGDEIMAGNVLDTNAAWLSDRCWMAGWRVVWRFSVADDAGAIGEACRLAGAKAGVVLVTGGLGPTADDLTLEAAAKVFGKKLECHRAVLRDIEKFFKRVGREMAPSNEKQAWLPEGGEPLPNKVGTAPGCQVTFGKSVFFFLPGVPAEMYPMFDDFVLPWMREQGGGRTFYREKILRCFGAPEATLDTELRGADLGKVRLSFRVRFPEVWLKLACRGKTATVAEGAVEQAAARVRDRVGKFVYGEGSKSLPEVVGDLLRSEGKKVAVAESCTGGFLSNAMTDIPGASDYFERGVVSYSDASKSVLLGVPEALIRKHGAVSPEVALRMAQGARETASVDYGIGITGIAGPGGGTPVRRSFGEKTKPVGTVYVALASAEKSDVREYHFHRERLEFKILVAFTALDRLRRELVR